MLDPKEANNYLVKVSPAEIADFFSTFKIEAFRFESLEEYRVIQEREYIKKYIENPLATPPEDFNSGWLDIVKKAQDRKAKLNRVRFIANPDSDYIKFEASWGYKKSLDVGENIFLLNKQLDDIFERVPILKDFWLFDDRHCFIMNYDYVGRFLGAEKVENAELIRTYVLFKTKLLEESTEIKKTEFWKTLAI